MSIGPVQLLVVGFDEPKFTGEIAAELNKLRASGAIRVLDMLMVEKSDTGNLETVQVTDLTPAQARDAGALIGSLIGLGAGGEQGMKAGADLGAEAAAEGHLFTGERVPEIAESMPAGSAAAIILIEHRWAAPLRDAVAETGGFPILDSWIRPADLMAIGVAASEM